MWYRPRTKSSEHLLLAHSQIETALDRRAARLRVQLYSLCALLLVCASTYAAFYHSPVAQANSLPIGVLSLARTAAATPAVVAPVITPSPVAAAVVVQPAVVASAPVVAPSCTPDTSYQLPTGIALPQTGLVQAIDTPATYFVYGNTAAQVTTQMALCTPVHSTGSGGTAGRYAASTADAISWNLSYENDGSGTCTVTSASVSLHINQVFPVWQPSSGSLASLASQWQNYSAKLHAYEQGHVALDEQNAAAILSDLQNFPPTDCASIEQAANTKARAEVTAYDAANANYDVVNNFGLKQGVVL